MNCTDRHLVNRFCQIGLIFANHKSGRLPEALIEEESQIRREAWDRQISPDELHLASLRYKQVNGIGITDSQISDHIRKMRSWKQEKRIQDARLTVGR